MTARASWSTDARYADFRARICARRCSPNDLAFADLTGAKLRATDFRGAILQGISFRSMAVEAISTKRATTSLRRAKNSQIPLSPPLKALLKSDCARFRRARPDELPTGWRDLCSEAFRSPGRWCIPFGASTDTGTSTPPRAAQPAGVVARDFATSRTPNGRKYASCRKRDDGDRRIRTLEVMARALTNRRSHTQGIASRSASPTSPTV